MISGGPRERFGSEFQRDITEAFPTTERRVADTVVEENHVAWFRFQHSARDVPRTQAKWESVEVDFLICQIFVLRRPVWTGDRSQTTGIPGHPFEVHHHFDLRVVDTRFLTAAVVLAVGMSFDFTAGTDIALGPGGGAGQRECVVSSQFADASVGVE